MTTIELMDKYAKETHEIVKQVIELWQQEVVFLAMVVRSYCNNNHLVSMD